MTDDKDTKAPTNLDGSPADKEDVGRAYQGLITGEMSFNLAPGVEEELAKAGMSKEDLRKMVLRSFKKTMS